MASHNYSPLQVLLVRWHPWCCHAQIWKFAHVSRLMLHSTCPVEYAVSFLWLDDADEQALESWSMRTRQSNTTSVVTAADPRSCERVGANSTLRVLAHGGAAMNYLIFLDGKMHQTAARSSCEASPDAGAPLFFCGLLTQFLAFPSAVPPGGEPGGRPSHRA